jgi:hypothetical protein
MLFAVRRYSAALSLALGAGVLAQPALAHGRFADGGARYHRHHHSAYAIAMPHYARSHGRRYGRRHSAFMMAAAPQTWGEQSGSYMSASPSWPSGQQNYWQHGWRGHMAQQALLQQSAWQQNSWQQNSWQQDNWQRQSARQRRFAQRQQAAFYNNAAPGYTSTYDDYAPQSSWSSSYGGGFGGQSALSGMIAQAASTAGVPVSLAERVVRRESGGNPRAVHAGNYGLMQIRLGTARAMGYGGSAAGLLDPSTNMTYAMRYLAGAYRAAGGSESRAVALYARGYHVAPARVQTHTF